jgi:hypothetical protein
MCNIRILFLLLTINTFIIISTKHDLYGQSYCDTKAGPFVVCEEPPPPNISFGQLEDIPNSSIDVKNEHINEGAIIRIFFIINCKGEDFNYRTLQPADSTIKDKLFKTIHSNMKWTAGEQAGRKIDFQQQILLNIVNGKFLVLNDNDNKAKKNNK